MMDRQRKILRQSRQAIPLHEREQYHANIVRHATTLPAFKRAHHVAFYLPIAGEVATEALIQIAWEMNKTCYLPVLHPFHQGKLWFATYKPDTKLVTTKLGFLQPNTRHYQNIKSLDIVFTPLLGFDRHGNRLGSGRGYYDRTFAFRHHRAHYHKPMLVGLAYECQRTTLTPKPWDIQLDQVITEQA